MTNDVAWDIDNNGNIKPSDKSKVSGEITIPNIVDGKVVTGIASDAFKDCDKLTSVIILNNIGVIAKGAFSSCNSLISINIPNSVTTVGEYAFTSCTSLRSINIPSGVTSVGEHAFNDCVKLTTVNFTDDSKLNNIGNYAFNGCPLTSINIPNSVTRIGTNAFRNCSSLKDVTFNWNIDQLVADKLTLGNNLFESISSSQTINFHIPLGTKDQYKAKFTQDILGTNITANWIDDIVPPTPTPTNSSNLALILGLTFGFIILIGIGSYLGYRYYKHRKNSK